VRGCPRGAHGDRLAARSRGYTFAARSRGYTLIEMLVALIMFALISVATAFVLTSALRGQSELRRKTAEAQEARALLGVLTRDLRGAYVVTGSPTTYLVASGADSGAVLQLTTLATRLRPDPANVSAADPTTENAAPQSGTVQVTYDFDPDTGVMSRLATTLPGADSFPETGGPDYILSRRVRSIAFTFVDADGNTRNEWNFQTPTEQEAGADAASSYDTTLPVRVDVELELSHGYDETVLFRTSIALVNAEAQPAGQAPPAPPQPAGGPGGTGGPGGGGAP
jgi:prepilin-type N-terminal cleavage/methylation domain-containing protein